MTLYPKLITDALATVRYPGTGKNLVEAGMVEDNIRINGMKVSFSLIFEKSTDPFMKSLVAASVAAIHTYVGKDVEVKNKELGKFQGVLKGFDSEKVEILPAPKKTSKKKPAEETPVIPAPEAEESTAVDTPEQNNE